MKKIFPLICMLCILKLSYAQVTVRGTIKDEKFSEPLPGTVVKVKNTTTGAMTDFDGNFEVKAHIGDSLQITCYGYYPITRCITDNLPFTVKLKKDPKIPETCTGKPVIYLYPEKTSQVNLQFNYQGKLQTTYPQYANGWNVEAQPNGVLHTADGKEYSYLFWDGLKQYTKQELSYNSGFFVAGDSALQFLQRILPQTGLLPKEYNEFIVYWLPLMQANKLNFVHFRLQDDYSVISTNTVSPKPDVEIRVFMEFKAVDKVTAIKPQKINTPTRRGFTLVEWGGSEIKDEIQINETYIGYKP